MKNLIFLMLIFMFFGCSNNNEVYWCGDHACINKKERESFFKETMIVEKRKPDGTNKLTKSEKDEILKKIRLKEKKISKEQEAVSKQVRLEVKQDIKEAKILKKKNNIDNKECFSWDVQKRSIKRCFGFGRSTAESKKRETKKIVYLDEESPSKFDKLVEKINKRNMSKPYPDINNIPN